MSSVVKHARRSAAAAAVGALAFSGLVALSAAPAQAFDSSCTPADPVLKTLKVSPTKVNVKSGERTVIVSGTTSGPALGRVSVTADPVGKGHSRYGDTTKTKGNKFKVKISVPKGASKGQHNLEVSMTSKDDEYAWVTTEQLMERRLPHSFNAVSRPDHKAPKLTSIKLSKKSVKTTKKAAKVTVTAKASDKGGSGLGAIYAQIGNKHFSTYVSLTKKKGKLTGTAIVPKWAGKKKATVLEADVIDKAGNHTRYGKGEGAKKLTRKLKPTLKVKSKTDTKNPVVKSASGTPSTGKVGDKRWQMKFAVKAADSQSGVAWVNVKLAPRNTDGYSYASNWTYLENKKGTWRGTTTISCYTNPGTYDIEVTVVDRSGRETVTNKGAVTFS